MSWVCKVCGTKATSLVRMPMSMKGNKVRGILYGACEDHLPRVTEAE